MGKRESRIVAYLEHSPIRVGDKIVLETIGKKPPRITIEEVATGVEEVAIRVEQVATRVEEVAAMVKELAQIVHNGFSNVNARLDANDARWVKQEEFNKKQLIFNEMLITRIDNLVVKNNLKE